MIATYPSALELSKAQDPLDLLNRTLEVSGGAFRAHNSACAETIYFHPDSKRLSDFNTAERSGLLKNFNTPEVEDLFDGTVFVLSGEAHRHARNVLLRFFSSRANWQDDTTLEVKSWVERCIAEQEIDLLLRARQLAVSIFTRVVLGAAPESSVGRQISRLVEVFVKGAIDASGNTPEAASLRLAAEARDEIFGLALALGRADKASFAAHCLRSDPSVNGVRDVAAVLIASVETTANMIAWSVARWALADTLRQAQPLQFAQEIEGLDSPNTLVTRRVAAPMEFHGCVLEPGTYVSYSPASRSLNGQNDIALPLVFGSGQRTCPGRLLARHLVRITLSNIAASKEPWTLLKGLFPKPVVWFPVRSFGEGIIVRTCS